MCQNNLDIICRYILHINKDISHIKLQKLLYFIQAYVLVASEGKQVAFTEDIEAWMYGPTIKVVAMNYKKDKNYYRGELTREELQELDKLVIEATEKIVKELGNLSPYTLVNMTHSYATWKNAWNFPYKALTVIEKEDIYKFHSKMNKGGNMI